MSTSDQKQFSRYFKQKPILHQPEFNKIFGLPAGIMLMQLLYWNGKGRKKPWTYKTIQDFEKETGLTRTQQDGAIKKLKRHGILETKLMGVPAKRHFKLDLARLTDEIISLKKTYNLTYPNPPIRVAENRQTNTENTQKTTSDKLKSVSDLRKAKDQLAEGMSIK